MFQGEFATLGYPRAALFEPGVALSPRGLNVLPTVQAALRAEFGVEW
jgi:hypothetical protein